MSNTKSIFGKTPAENVLRDFHASNKKTSYGKFFGETKKSVAMEHLVPTENYNVLLKSVCKPESGRYLSNFLEIN